MYNDMINAYEETIGFAIILMALREIEQGREGERKGIETEISRNPVI